MGYVDRREIKKFNRFLIYKFFSFLFFPLRHSPSWEKAQDEENNNKNPSVVVQQPPNGSCISVLFLADFGGMWEGETFINTTKLNGHIKYQNQTINFNLSVFANRFWWKCFVFLFYCWKFEIHIYKGEPYMR